MKKWPCILKKLSKWADPNKNKKYVRISDKMQRLIESEREIDDEEEEEDSLSEDMEIEKKNK